MNNEHRPSLDEFLPMLASVESMPTSLLKASYSVIDSRSPLSEVIPSLYDLACEKRSTREVLEVLYPGLEIGNFGYSHFQNLMMAIEFNVRLVNGTAS